MGKIELEMVHEDSDDGYVFLQPSHKRIFETTDTEMIIIDKAEAQLLYSGQDDIPEHPRPGEKMPFGTIHFNSKGEIIEFTEANKSDAETDS